MLKPCFIRELVAAGRLKRVIAQTYSLEKVAEAHRQVENGHTQGRILVEVPAG